MTWFRRFVSSAAGAAAASVASACSEPKPPTDITAASATTQTSVAGANVGTPPMVKVINKDGDGVGGVVVTFELTGGGGSLGATSVTTADDGTASTSWKLGTAVGVNRLRASATGLTGSPVGFIANGTAGAPASMAIDAGINQVAVISSPVTIKPAVRILDANNNPVPDVTVTFAVTGGGGSLTGAVATTSSAGIATVGGWTLGANVGVNTLTASVAGLPTLEFTATAQDPPPFFSINAGDKQAVMVSTSVPTPPSVIVTKAGAPQAGVSVTFSVLGGGGSITGATTTTNANGIATVGSWTLGSGMGLNTLQASVDGQTVAGSPVTFVASGCGGVGSGYRITLCFTADMTVSQKAAFTSAAARWESIITGDLSDITLQPGNLVGGSSCGGRAFSMAGGTVLDDLLIFATIEPIDGPSNVLGSASPCLIRNSNHLSVVGSMRFDVADVGSLSASNLNSVILHEMGHVIGIGTTSWQALPNTTTPFLQNLSSSNTVNDTYFNGPTAVAAFNEAGGTAYIGNRVPVENSGGPGTINSHWRESVLKNELMTGFLDNNTNPLSAITVASLQDLGYSVNIANADPFVFSPFLMAPGSKSASSIPLVNDIDTFPVQVVDARGRVVRIIRR